MGCKMELHICHLYPNLLNMYGDGGNCKILSYRARKRGIEVFVHSHMPGDDFSPEKYDFVMLGGGQPFENKIVLEDLRGDKALKIKTYIENEGAFLAIGSGYQLLGNAMPVSGEETIEGLGILPVTTSYTEERFVGDIVISFGDMRLVGFENHAGCTFVKGMQPFGRVLKGYGNNGQDGFCGLQYKNFIGTFLHGPLLSKNPEFADFLLVKALEKKYEGLSLSPLDDSFAYRAKDEILKRLNCI